MSDKKFVVVRRHELEDGGDIEEWCDGNDFVQRPGGALYDTKEEAEDVKLRTGGGDNVKVEAVKR